jgi:hypothetical protein
MHCWPELAGAVGWSQRDLAPAGAAGLSRLAAGLAGWGGRELADSGWLADRFSHPDASSLPHAGTISINKGSEFKGKDSKKLEAAVLARAEQPGYAMTGSAATNEGAAKNARAVEMGGPPCCWLECIAGWIWLVRLA